MQIGLTGLDVRKHVGNIRIDPCKMGRLKRVHLDRLSQELHFGMQKTHVIIRIFRYISLCGQFGWIHHIRHSIKDGCLEKRTNYRNYPYVVYARQRCQRRDMFGGGKN
jgi:hypothetical protein